jgi:hypothetical protein
MVRREGTPVAAGTPTTEGTQTQDSGNTGRRDVNNSRTPATSEMPKAALMLKTTGSHPTEEAWNNVEAPGSEHMTTSAGPWQHQNAKQQH